MKTLIILETSWTDPHGVHHKPGFVEIEERYVMRNRVHGFRFRYPTDAEVKRHTARKTEKLSQSQSDEVKPDAVL